MPRTGTRSETRTGQVIVKSLEKRIAELEKLVKDLTGRVKKLEG
jgi:uncharacterized protein involved in exopolysaccharide biosynthesis